MARKARPSEQLVSGNIGQIKDVGGDRLREGVVDSGHLAPASVGGVTRSGDQPSLLDTFSGMKHGHMDLNRPIIDGKQGRDGMQGPPGQQGTPGLSGVSGPQGLDVKTVVGVPSTPPGVGLQIR